MRPSARDASILLTLAYPAIRALQAGGAPLTQRELDSVGHVWTVWSSSRGDLLHSDLVAWPDGADLLPILGGWLDIFIGSSLVRFGLDATRAFDLVLLGYLALAGLGIAVLARVLGAGPWAAAVAGVLAQLDPTLLWNLRGGRSEQISLGLVALALAGALSCWRRPGIWRWLACGLAGAGVVYASWEFGVWLAFAMAWLTPFALWSGRSGGAVRRWLLAAATCAVVAGPFAVLFLVRSAKVRVLEEGLTMLDQAPNHSVALLGWFSNPDRVRPGSVVLLALLTLPWTVRSEDRRLLVGALLGLAACLVLALGPDPGLWTVGDLNGASWAPYTALQSTPILGWFHTPDRLLVGWSIAAPVASGLLLHRLWTLRLLLPLRLVAGVALTVLLGGSSLQRARHLGLLQYPTWQPPENPALVAVRDAPAVGALLDLPPRPPGIASLIFVELQLVHHRPIPYHATLPHLTTADPDALGRRYALVDWLGRAGGPDTSMPESAIQADAEALRGDGYAFLVLNPQMVPRNKRRAVTNRLQRALGTPYAQQADSWLAWSLTGLEAPTTGAR